MLILIEAVLTRAEVADFRTRLATAGWQDGAASAGPRAAAVKSNLQLPADDPVGQALGRIILGRLGHHPQFIAASLAERIHPPRFNCYQDGGHYGLHVDSPLMQVAGDNRSLRTDLSATLFLSEPQDYDGGELTIEGPFGAQAAKLAAGDLLLYPASSLHMVTPVTRGQRLAAFFWIQSAIADERARALLYDLDQSIQALAPGRPADDPDINRLTHIYQNLVRRWAAT